MLCPIQVTGKCGSSERNRDRFQSGQWLALWSKPPKSTAPYISAVWSRSTPTCDADFRRICFQIFEVQVLSLFSNVHHVWSVSKEGNPAHISSIYLSNNFSVFKASSSIGILFTHLFLIHFQQCPVPLQLRLQLRLGGHDRLVFAGKQLGFVGQQRILGNSRVAL